MVGDEILTRATSSSKFLAIGNSDLLFGGEMDGDFRLNICVSSACQAARSESGMGDARSIRTQNASARWCWCESGIRFLSRSIEMRAKAPVLLLRLTRP